MISRFCGFLGLPMVNCPPVFVLFLMTLDRKISYWDVILDKIKLTSHNETKVTWQRAAKREPRFVKMQVWRTAWFFVSINCACIPKRFFGAAHSSSLFSSTPRRRCHVKGRSTSQECPAQNCIKYQDHDFAVLVSCPLALARELVGRREFWLHLVPYI